MKRVGVIIGVAADLPESAYASVMPYLQARFPGVTFAVVGGAVDSVTFEWDDGVGTTRGTPHGTSPKYNAGCRCAECLAGVKP